MTEPPPIIPGTPEQFTLSKVLPAGGPPKRGWKGLLVVGATVLATLTVVGGVILVIRPGGLGLSSAAAPASAAPTPLRAAYSACSSAGTISDADRTLFLDTGGNKGGSGSLPMNSLMCVLDALHTPSYVTTRMQQTRALDGQVSETWSTFKATWTYHPDAGLDVLIHDAG